MSPIVWIIIGIMILAACFSGKGNRKACGSRGEPTRIDHPHYIDVDDYECSVCGARFRKKGMVCPKCGARFQKTMENEDEFIEEMVIWDDDD